MREGLTVIIALLILGILLDGIRRMRAHRRDSLRLARRMVDDSGATEERELTSSEFPSGGARVAARRDPHDIEHVNQHLKENYAASKMTRGAPNRIPEQVSLNLDASVPMLMDSVEAQEESEAAPAEATAADHHEQENIEPALGDFANLDEGDAAQASEPAKPLVEGSESVPALDGVDSEDVPSKEKPKPVRESARAQKKRREEQEKIRAAEKASAVEAPTKMPDEVLIINVMAKRGDQFSGADLLDAMVSQGLKFGDMDIFHRHENEDGSGKILFSVANIVVPGTFELGAMEDFSTPGISMFLSLPIPGDSIAAFNLMADSAHAIAQHLGGELKDENRSVMTRQTIEHARQRVVEYERKRRLTK